MVILGKKCTDIKGNDRKKWLNITFKMKKSEKQLHIKKL